RAIGDDPPALAGDLAGVDDLELVSAAVEDAENPPLDLALVFHRQAAAVGQEAVAVKRKRLDAAALEIDHLSAALDAGEPTAVDQAGVGQRQGSGRVHARPVAGDFPGRKIVDFGHAV